MKFLRYFLSLCCVLSLTATVGTLTAQELPDNGYLLHPSAVNFNNGNVQHKITIKGDDRPLAAAEFFIIDSLANAYSYFSSNTQPYVYHVATNTLTTIKRGYISDPLNTGTYTKDNLFYRESKDWGKTWGPAEMLYNSKVDDPTYMARYPSIYPFEYDGALRYVYTAPVTSGDGWMGVINGLFYDYYVASYQLNFTFDGKTYGWSTDSKILGGFVGTDAWGFAIGGVMPPGGNQWDNNSNVAYRTSTQFDQWESIIPPAWSASKFIAVTQDSSRANEIVGLKMLPDGKMYIALFGAFLNDGEKARPGVSISNGYGEAWSEFADNENVMPYTLFKNYANGIGAIADSTFLTYGSKDFVLFDNGDFSFFCQLYESVDTNIKKADLQARQIIEIYKESGAWGIRKVADVSGLVLVYLKDGQAIVQNGRQVSGNQLDMELQASRTPDGNNIVAKWVEFVDFDVNGQTVTSTDIFMAARNTNSDAWGKAIDITESLIYDRVTWIPDYIPNDLKDIPVLKTESVPRAGDDETAARLWQREVEVNQYVKIGLADATPSFSIVEQEDEIPSLEILNITPNPCDIDAIVDINLKFGGNVSIELYNLMGSKVQNVYNHYMSNGLHSVRIATNDLAAGAYYCVISFNGSKITKQINVIR